MRFLGQFECAGDSTEPAPDREGTQRSAIVFEFVLASVGDKPLEVGEEQTEEVDVDLAVVRSRALDAARLTPQVAGTESRRSLYRRSAAVRRYALAQAAGICESCNQPALFVTLRGEPYLEPHHTRRFSDGGPDDRRFVGVVCPGCHREIHHGLHGPVKNERLVEAIRQKERDSDT